MAFILNDGAVVPASVYSAMNTVLNKKLGTSQVYPPRDWAAIVRDLVPLPIKSASGSIAHFSDGADTVPLKSLAYTLTPTQSGAGDPSPSNPRPINSVSSLGLVHTGVNLVDSSDVSITTNRNELSSDKAVLIKAGITYTASISNIQNATSWCFCFRVYDGAGNLITNAKTNGYINTVMSDTYDTNRTIMQGQNSTATNIQFECLKDCYIAVGLSSGNISSSTTADYQLQVGSTPTTYEPYTSATHTVNLGGVYGGTGNEAGEFENGFTVIDLADLTWTTSGNRAYCSDLVNVIKKPTSPSEAQKSIAEQIKIVNYGASLQANQMTVYSDGRLIAYYNGATPEGDFCYELATPTTMAVDPVAISSRLGENNIFADVGGSNIEVEYYADPTLSTQ